MSKKLSENVKKELDSRLKNLKEVKTELYSWDEVKNYIKTIRNSHS